MKARSNEPASPLATSASSVRLVGARWSSIRPSTPASRQYRRAIDVHSSLTSQATRRPSGGRARATEIALYPVKDRQSDGEGKRGSGRVDFGGRRISEKTNKENKRS